MANNSQNSSNMSGLGFATLGMGLLNNIGNIFTANKQLKAQKEENEKNRQFNAEQAELARQFNADEAQKARDYNSQMVNEQNAYNSPSAMMSRLQDAGLNPNLVYGDLGNSSVGIGSASMAAGSPAANMSAGVGTALPSFTNAAKDMAEVELLKAQAKAVDADRGLKEKEIARYDEIVDGNVRVANSVWNLNNKSASWKEQQIVESAKRVEEMDATINEINQNASLLGAQWIAQNYQNILTSETWDSAVKAIIAKNQMAQDEARLFVDFYKSTIVANIAKANNDNAHAKSAIQEAKNKAEEFNNIQKIGLKLDIENDTAYFNLGQEVKWQDWERILSAASEVLGIAVDAYNAKSGRISAKNQRPRTARIAPYY